MVPPLTTVKIYMEFMGETAVGLMIEQLKYEREIAKKIVIPTKIIKRGSCSQIKTNL
ncbi:substrate-binding domain-containing protein [uncultured Clostridium sp.]|uniref:substrate-binding domain-containing protein n=1 Tax=uncultured Clostridium sp. TaxID=59620 RepID=UPI00345B770F